MKIVVFEAEEREASAFERISLGNDIALVKEPLAAANAARYADAEIVSPFVYSQIDRVVLDTIPTMKLIATRSTGYDHIDIAHCRSRGIRVCNVPSYGENTVAEHVFALLLAISHRLPEAMERARGDRFSPEGLQGFDLAGRIMGVMGTGNIGRHVVRISKGFGMEVVAHDIRPDPAFAAMLGFSYVARDELYAMADIISLHLPATAQTHNLIDHDAFARMKDGVVIINTARGGIIDSAALIKALSSGRVAAAGLDVLADEPLIREEAELISSIYEGRHDLRNLVADHVLLRMRNVIVTPHSAFNTHEAVQRIVETTVSNIEAFLRGAPANEVAAAD